MFRLCLKSSLVLGFVLFLSIAADAQFRRRRDEGPRPKNISGVVQYLTGKPIVGANVFVRDMKSKVVRTLTTDQQGLYSIFGLSATVDYEVWAEYRGKSSEKKYVSSFLNRADNNLNFQLDVSVIEDKANDRKEGPEFQTYDLVRLHGSFELPTGIPAPIPAVLLLHGYGEDRWVWDSFKKQLLARGWAVMTVDLRGHGDSKTKNQKSIEALPEWRTSPHEFPLDLDPALDWLKARSRIDSDRIVVIGSDVGANLALIASGRFPQVRTVVAIDPKLSEALAMAGSAQDFHPKSALIVVSNEEEGNRIKSYVQPPARVSMLAGSGATTEKISKKEIVDAIFQWLRETF